MMEGERERDQLWGYAQQKSHKSSYKIIWLGTFSKEFGIKRKKFNVHISKYAEEINTHIEQ